MDYKNIFDYAIKTGEVMLRNGAETSRVEDTINRIMACTQFEVMESFVTPTGIFATLDDPSIEMITYVKRVHKREVNLNKVAQANDLSRRFCAGQVSIEDANAQLLAVIDLPAYSPLVISLAKGLGAGAFAMVYGGDFVDLLVAAFIGFLLGNVQHVFGRWNANKFFIDLIGGALISSLTILFFYGFHIGNHFDIIIIGGIMPLVPGVAITNAIRDTITGDFLSGISRTTDAFTVATAVAVGVGGALKIFSLFNGGLL